jgi:predicted glycogen debranching enzyme
LEAEPHSFAVIQENSLPVIEFGRDVCNRKSAFEKEWLVTNGLGGYASGTLSGSLSRRYHGLLIASLDPPLRRTLLFSKLDETIILGETRTPIYTNTWSNRRIDPPGHTSIDSFCLIGTTPKWTYRIGEALLTKKIWMRPDQNTTYIQYSYMSGSMPMDIEAKVLINFRSHHKSSWRSPRTFEISKSTDGMQVTCEQQAPFWLFFPAAEITSRGEWYRDYFYPVEAYRGLDAFDDHFLAANLRYKLEPGGSCLVVASTYPHPELDAQAAWNTRVEYESGLLTRAKNFLVVKDPPQKIQHLVLEPIKSLILAADQFIVSRPTNQDPDGKTVIAGYPWFTDWGRDTMISLVGLTLVTGRPEIARKILRTFATFIDQGMLPNRFPAAGAVPEYNTVDATLWYFYAIDKYLRFTKDEALLKELYPGLEDIISWHIRGTRHQIMVDPQDNLLYAGEDGAQLTWMDAKVGDWVVTPRIGKPVEINALWYNALVLMAQFAERLGKPRGYYQELSTKVLGSFQKFWNLDLNCLYDVIDGPLGLDNSVRPNQILAVSLPHSPLPADKQITVLETCTHHLLTPFGLRSLAPDSPDYIGIYGGNQHQRDVAYHQGTVWAWLIGPYLTAKNKLLMDPMQAEQLLAPFLRHLTDHGISSISEIFEGDPPFNPRGCIAQAWSVAEVLRVWAEIHS